MPVALVSAASRAVIERTAVDFRHGLAAPAVARDAAGPVLSLVHGPTRVTVALSEESLGALVLALVTGVTREAC